MRPKKILLVADDPSDADDVRHALVGLGIPHTLHIVHSGADALATLMGSSSAHMENYARTGKVQPDLILLNQTLPDMGCLEFLSIMRKYYSLKNIRVQILAHAPHELDAKLVASLGIAGYIPRTEGEKRLIATDHLKRALSGEAVGAFLPFLALNDIREFISGFTTGFWKIKFSMPAFAGGIGTKVAAVTGTAVLLAGTAGYVMAPAEGNSTAPEKVSALISPESMISASATAETAETLRLAEADFQQVTAGTSPRVENTKAAASSPVVSTVRRKPPHKNSPSDSGPEVIGQTAVQADSDEAATTRRVFVIKAVADEE